VTGIGEAAYAYERMLSYIRPITNRNIQQRRGALVNHFAAADHSIEDFQFTLIDKLPVDTPFHVRDQVRRYLESQWIAKCGSTLNVRRNYTVSFGGGTTANRRPGDRSASE
jgi:hypothetical protein